MSFLVFLLCGVAGGILGGMGMGGGTALIPLLTLLCGVEQGVAQGVNLAAFLPMSLSALCVHLGAGLVKRGEVLPYALPALPASVLFALVASLLPARSLRAGFGAFLVLLSVVRLFRVFRECRECRECRVSRVSVGRNRCISPSGNGDFRENSPKKEKKY